MNTIGVWMLLGTIIFTPWVAFHELRVSEQSNAESNSKDESNA